MQKNIVSIVNRWIIIFVISLTSNLIQGQIDVVTSDPGDYGVIPKWVPESKRSSFSYIGKSIIKETNNIINISDLSGPDPYYGLRLSVNGGIKVNGFLLNVSPGNGYYLTSDEYGNGSWVKPNWIEINNKIFAKENRSIVIGNNDPYFESDAKLSLRNDQSKRIGLSINEFLTGISINSEEHALDVFGEEMGIYTGTTTGYGIYQDGWESSKNYFASNIGITNYQPLTKLHLGSRFTLHDTLEHNYIACNVYSIDKYIQNEPASKINLADNGSISLKTAPNGTENTTITWNEGIFINNAGNVGMGNTNPQAKLHVNGSVIISENSVVTPAGYNLYVENGILTEKVKVELSSNWSDFVFEKDYALMSLPQLEKYINTYKHLPDIPTAKQVKEEGINLGEMDAKLLQKVEELTLYIIEQQKQIEELKTQIEKLKK